MNEFCLTQKQEQAVDVIAKNKFTLIEGGARSGKTFLIIRAMLLRAFMVPESYHIALRLRRSHIEGSIWQQTLPQVISKCGWKGLIELNNSDLLCKIKQNGSWVAFDGLDDKDRVDKILGKEYSTIFLNEVSQIGFNEYETLTTRLNPTKGLNPKFILDWNPTSQRHWAYRIFHNRKFPDGKSVPENDYGLTRINPFDNKQNISETLFDTLSNLSGSKRKRFLDGEASEEEGALWVREWFKYGIAPENLFRCVVGVDPSGSTNGDEIGIVVAAFGENGSKYILADYSMHGKPNEWANEVYNAYDRFSADCVVAEKNFGGEMVEAVISDMGRKPINVKLVNASRSKTVRAEPISAMYSKGEVIHAGEFLTLEDEMCTYKPMETKDSPNRMDALVWALTELSEGGSNMAYVDEMDSLF